MVREEKSREKGGSSGRHVTKPCLARDVREFLQIDLLALRHWMKAYFCKSKIEGGVLI